MCELVVPRYRRIDLERVRSRRKVGRYDLGAAGFAL
jgi:hypothetical protein